MALEALQVLPPREELDGVVPRLAFGETVELRLGEDVQEVVVVRREFRRGPSRPASMAISVALLWYARMYSAMLSCTG